MHVTKDLCCLTRTIQAKLGKSSELVYRDLRSSVYYTLPQDQKGYSLTIVVSQPN